MTVAHQPANLGVSAHRFFRVLPLPDIISANGPIVELRWLARRCTDLLDDYSRFVGRQPARHDSLEAIALLPRQLLETHGGTAVAALRTWLNLELATHDTVTVTYADILNHWQEDRDRFSRSVAVRITTLFEKLGASIHPDPRLDRRSPTPDTCVEVTSIPTTRDTARRTAGDREPSQTRVIAS